jgi:polysaccharide transporter, PST family
MGDEMTSLGRTASRSAATAAAGQIIRLGVQVAGIVALARLLSPSDYGVLALGVAVTGFGELLRDFGLANASVQARTLSVEERSNLFWLNTAIGAVLAAVTASASTLIAGLLGAGALAPVIAALGVGFLFSGLATQPRASLVRDMRFLALNVCDTAALLISTTLGIMLALAGAGYWALVLMLLAQGALAWIATAVAAGWLPGVPNRRASVRPFLRFGAGQFGSQALGYAAKNASTFVIGVALGLVPLGLYNRANQLLNLPLAQLQAPATQVALPTLSRLQDDPVQYDRYLLRGQLTLLHATTAVLALSAAAASPLFGVLLGAQWVPAAPIFQVLALGGFAMVANYATYWVFLSKGLTRSYLHLSFVIQPANVVAVLLGAMGGLFGIVAGSAIVNLLIWPLTLLWLSKVSSAPVRALFFNSVRTVCAYGSAGLVALLATLWLAPWPWMQVFACVIAFALVVFAWLVLSRPFRADARGIIDVARLMRQRA